MYRSIFEHTQHLSYRVVDHGTTDYHYVISLPPLSFPTFSTKRSHLIPARSFATALSATGMMAGNLFFGMYVSKKKIIKKIKKGAYIVISRFSRLYLF